MSAEKPRDAVPAQPGARPAARRAERLPGVHLNLKLGGPLVLQFAQPASRYAGTVVGFESYAYFIVQARIPRDVLAQLAVNTPLAVQHTASGRIYHFHSYLLNRVASPAPLLILSFPETVDRIALRSHDRVSVNLPGSLHGKYGEHAAMVLDLTPTGCKLMAKVDLKSPLRGAQAGERLALSLQLAPGAPLALALILRRVAEEKGRMTLGAQFAELTPEDGEAVAAYIAGLQTFLDR